MMANGVRLVEGFFSLIKNKGSGTKETCRLGGVGVAELVGNRGDEMTADGVRLAERFFSLIKNKGSGRKETSGTGWAQDVS